MMLLGNPHAYFYWRRHQAPLAGEDMCRHRWYIICKNQLLREMEQAYFTRVMTYTRSSFGPFDRLYAR